MEDNSTIKSSFTENLKKMRSQKGISQDELAKKIDMHPVQYSRYERGQTVPSIEVVQKIAMALDVSLDELVYGNSEAQAAKDIDDRELLSMFKKVQLLNKQKKETVKDFLSAFLLKENLTQQLNNKF